MSVWNPQANKIFLDAIEIAALEGRNSFIDRACDGNTELREQVESLISASQKASNFLEKPQPAVASIATLNLTPAERQGTQIGPYKLLEQIGEGGMGTVFMAEQLEPVQRTVALKVIKPGMDSRQVIARFATEKQALAMMEHVCIARVLDAGVTETGLPYFVMELVRGVPITQFCDDHHLTLPQRLELFVTVCQAIQHAHQKGIIHRDIKPSNVLVTLIDGQPIAKVIDFGVAKAISQSIAEQSILTASNQIVGTPLYMSPEQAEMNALDVDTRSDVYSLGVLLYELLTGSTPLDSVTMRQAGFDEMRRVIREVDPPRPSQRISTLTAEADSTISKSRGVVERRLERTLRGELDWIVMKALEKDRNRRYESASAFAADVKRYLDHEPVEACPVSMAYRVRKFASRYRAAIATVAVIAMTMLAGTAISIWQAVEATSARKLADERLLLADQRLIGEMLARKEADIRRVQARRAVDEMYTGVAEEWLGQQPELTMVQRDFLEKALAFYEQFAAEGGDDPLVRLEEASARLRSGKIQRALGAFDQSEVYLTKSISQLEELLEHVPDRTHCLKELTDAMHSLVQLNSELGKTVESERLLKQCIAQFEDSLVQNPNDEELQSQLATYLRMQVVTTLTRDPEAAEKYALRSRDLFQKLLVSGNETVQIHLENARVEKLLASLFYTSDRLPEAERLIHVAIEKLEEQITKNPADKDFRWLLGDFLQVQAAVLDGLGRREEAIDAFRRAALIRTSQASEFPTRENRGGRLTALFNLIQSLTNQEEIESVGRQGIELGEGLVLDFPTVPVYQADLTVFHLALGHNLRNSQPEQARMHLERAYELSEKLLTNFPGDPGHAIIFAVTSSFSASHYASGPPNDPLFNPTLALQRAQRAVGLMPENIALLSALGCAQYRTDDFEKCIETIERMDAKEPIDFFDDFYVAMANSKLGNKSLALEKFHRAEQSLSQDWDPQKYPDKRTALKIRDEAAALLGVALSSKEQTPNPIVK